MLHNVASEDAARLGINVGCSTNRYFGLYWMNRFAAPIEFSQNDKSPIGEL
jgi:hypothetical protein